MNNRGTDFVIGDGANLDRLPEKLARLVEQELLKDEVILWLGQSNAKKQLLSAGAWLASLFGILLLYFLVPLTIGMVETAIVGHEWGYLVLVVFILLFNIIGVGLVLLPISNWHEAKYRVYLVTDQRLACVRMFRRHHNTETLPYSQVVRFLRSQDANGRGTLGFTDASADDSDNVFTFDDIEQVQMVEELIKKRIKLLDEDQVDISDHSSE